MLGRAVTQSVTTSLCPSCHQKRVVEFGEYLFSEVLKQVPHRQWVFSIPKRLRPYFLYDRKLLSKLSKCIWKILSCYLKGRVTVENPTPGAVFALQTFGESLNFNPHFHLIVTDGCFYDSDKFMVGKAPAATDLELIFRTEVLKMLKKEGKINCAIIENMNNWQHSGFNVYCAMHQKDYDLVISLALDGEKRIRTGPDC